MSGGLVLHADGHARCWWCGTDPLYVTYHDTEWGVPERDGRALYEKLILDGFQAGLSWITILRKRDAFRRAFAGFEPQEIARFTEAHVEALMLDAGIVRNRAKIEGTILSARAYLDMGGPEAFSRFLWDYVGGAPLQTRRETRGDIPPANDLSKEVSAALKKAGFKFCGPTIVYAFMQACGLVNDHLVGCHRQLVCEEMAGS
jgi:DNA-3-methyladenine glycosylase I